MKRHSWMPVLMVASLVLGCQPAGSDPLEAPTPSPVSQPATATPTVPPLPSPWPTITPSPTPFPSSLDFPASLASLRIAFTDNKNIWLWQNGAAAPLTAIEGYTPVKLSDDGKMIAFQRNGLWVINSDGTEQRQLVAPEDLDAFASRDQQVELFGFDWIAQTHTLLFNITLPGFGIFHRDDLHLANADTLQWKTLRSAGEGGNFRISPNGKQVVMVTPHEIRLMNTDGTGYRRLLQYSQIDTGSEYFYYVSPIWALDSRSVIVDVPPREFRQDPSLAPRVIWELPVDGRARREVAQLPAQYDYLISPDLSKIAYVKSPEDAANEIHVANIDGSEDMVYSFGTGMGLDTWAPDSEHFVLILWATQQYYLARVGAEPIPLTEPASQNFVWIDEQYFLYRRFHGEACELRLGSRGSGTAVSSLVLIPAIEDCANKPYDFIK